MLTTFLKVCMLISTIGTPLFNCTWCLCGEEYAIGQLIHCEIVESLTHYFQAINNSGITHGKEWGTSQV